MTPSPSWQAPRSPAWTPPPGSSSGTPTRRRTPSRTRSSAPGVICPRCATRIGSTPGCIGCWSAPASMRSDGFDAIASTSTSPTSRTRRPPPTPRRRSPTATSSNAASAASSRRSGRSSSCITTSTCRCRRSPRRWGSRSGTAKSRLYRGLREMRAALDADARSGPEIRRRAPRMTTSDDFDRTVSDWLHEEAEHRVPDHLDEVLVRTRPDTPATGMVEPRKVAPRADDASLHRRRPGSPGCWSSSALHRRHRARPRPRGRARDRACPPPFGPARNGPIVVQRRRRHLRGRSGRPARETAADRRRRPFDFGPTFSRDGTQVHVPSRAPTDATSTRARAHRRRTRTGAGVRVVSPAVPGLDWHGLVAGRDADRVPVATGADRRPA